MDGYIYIHIYKISLLMHYVFAFVSVLVEDLFLVFYV